MQTIGICDIVNLVSQNHQGVRQLIDELPNNCGKKCARWFLLGDKLEFMDSNSLSHIGPTLFAVNFYCNVLVSSIYIILEISKNERKAESQVIRELTKSSKRRAKMHILMDFLAW